MTLWEEFKQGVKDGTRDFFFPLVWLWKKLKKYMEEVCA